MLLDPFTLQIVYRAFPERKLCLVYKDLPLGSPEH